MKNKIDDLRNHLFATMEALQDKDEPMPLDRARAIAEVAQVVVNSAKVEVEFLKVMNDGPTGKGSGFIPAAPERQPLPPPAAPPRLVGGKAS